MIDPKTARRGLALVFTTLLLDIIGFGMIMPVLPAFLRELTGVGISEAAIEGGWLFFVYAAMQFFFAPIMGGLSDRFGRRPILLASVLTFSIDNLICAIAWSYPMLFIGRVLAGISGASYSTTSAFIADISNDENRAKNSACSVSPSASASSSGRCWADCSARSGRACRSFSPPGWPS